MPDIDPMGIIFFLAGFLSILSSCLKALHFSKQAPVRETFLGLQMTVSRETNVILEMPFWNPSTWILPLEML